MSDFSNTTTHAVSLASWMTKVLSTFGSTEFQGNASLKEVNHPREVAWCCGLTPASNEASQSHLLKNSPTTSTVKEISSATTETNTHAYKSSFAIQEKLLL